MDIPTSSSLRVSRLLKSANEKILNQAFTINGVAPSNVRICFRSFLPAYGYVNFDKEEDAKTAMEALAYKKIEDLSDDLLVTYNNRDILNATECVFIKGLDKEVTSKKLHEVASNFGPVYTAFAPRSNDESLGYGKIIFFNADGKKAILEKNEQTEVTLKQLGEDVQVSEFVPRTERSDLFTNILVKNLPVETTDEQYAELLSQFGKITVMDGSKKPAAPLRTKAFPDGTSAKYGFANFSTHEEAVAAIEGLNKREFQGRVLEATRHHSKSIHALNTFVEHTATSANYRTKYPNCNLLIHNLPKDFTVDQLKTAFSAYGTIVRCALDPKVPGKAYVLYENMAAGSAAIDALNNSKTILDMETPVEIQVIRVIKDYPKNTINTTPASFPTSNTSEEIIFSTTWREIEASNYQNNLTEDERVLARGNAIYENVVEAVANADIPQNMKDISSEDVASRVTGMIISAKWSNELAEFIAFAEDAEQLKAKVQEGINIISQATESK